MKTPTIVVVMTMLACTVLTALNWSAIASPTTLSVGFTSVHAPLGVLLTCSALLTATFLVFVVFQQTTSLVEARRFARDLRAERDVHRLEDLLHYHRPGAARG